MKKLIATAVAFGMIASAALAADKVVRIGIFEPASGDSGAGGKQETLGAQFGFHETPTVVINGEKYKLSLIHI